MPPAKLLLAEPGANTTGAYGSYATLALGSALALFMYPHAITGVFAAKRRDVIRRNMAFLPLYSIVLGLIAQLAVGAWWIDAVTALAIVWFLVEEGREAWQIEEDDHNIDETS